MLKYIKWHLDVEDIPLTLLCSLSLLDVSQDLELDLELA